MTPALHPACRRLTRAADQILDACGPRAAVEHCQHRALSTLSTIERAAWGEPQTVAIMARHGLAASDLRALAVWYVERADQIHQAMA